MPGFHVHPRLAADCHRLGRFATCHLLLHRNALVPWFILVPQGAAGDLLGLPPALRDAVMDECSRIAAFVRARFGTPHINFAAIGNLVPQLHLHVVGRSPGDACWPDPIWGHLRGSAAYAPRELAALAHALRADWGLEEPD